MPRSLFSYLFAGLTLSPLALSRPAAPPSVFQSVVRAQRVQTHQLYQAQGRIVRQVTRNQGATVARVFHQQNQQTRTFLNNARNVLNHTPVQYRGAAAARLGNQLYQMKAAQGFQRYTLARGIQHQNTSLVTAFSQQRAGLSLLQRNVRQALRRNGIR